MPIKLQWIVAALIAGAFAAPAAAGQHEGKSAGGCCAKHAAAEATTDQRAQHEHVVAPNQDAVIQVVRTWLDAIPKRETARIAQLLADDFVATLPDGRRRLKSEHLKEVADGSYAVQALTMEDTSVRFFGPVAVVTYYQGEESRTLGQDTSGMSAWTDVLVNRNGTWQIVAEHGSRFK